SVAFMGIYGFLDISTFSGFFCWCVWEIFWCFYFWDGFFFLFLGVLSYFFGLWFWNDFFLVSLLGVLGLWFFDVLSFLRFVVVVFRFWGCGWWIFFFVGGFAKFTKGGLWSEMCMCGESNWLWGLVSVMQLS
ncbi:MAG: hypothetical protein QXS27_04650, partial [Candidatus Jordarchaeaceae archaeon]